MTRFWAKWLVILLLPGFSGGALATDMVVLVASKKSQLETLSSLELRKIYLGFNVHDQQGNLIKAIINKNDDRLQHIFLQNVVAMSERSYSHRLLSLMVRRGIPRPESFQSLKALHLKLLANPDSVSFMWMENAKKLKGLKVIRVLWQKN